MKVYAPSHINVPLDSGLSESAMSSVTAKRFRQSGIENSRRKKLIQSFRLTFDVLKEAYFVYALVISLKAGLTLSYPLLLM
jgi:hypothetical protein